MLFPELGKLYGNATRLKEYPVTGDGVRLGVGVFDDVIDGVTEGVLLGVLLGV